MEVVGVELALAAEMLAHCKLMHTIARALCNFLVLSTCSFTLFLRRLCSHVSRSGSSFTSWRR